MHYVRDPRYEEVKVSKKGEPDKFETKLKDRGVGDRALPVRNWGIR